MQRTFILLLLAAILVLPGCGSHVPVTTTGHMANFNPEADEALAWYFLPRTLVTIDVEISETVERPGPYAAYARKYLGLDDVIMEPARTYEIASVKINQYVEPDPEQVYYVTIPDRDDDEAGFLMSLSEAGLLYSFNKAYEDGEFEKSLTRSHDVGHFGTDATFNYFIDTNLKEQIDTVIEHVMLDTITIQRETFRSSWVEKSDELRASEVAEYILELREKKFDLISGFQEINYSKEALEYMYGEMDRMENDYLDLFTGIKASDTIRYRFVHKPLKEDIISRYTLFYFSSSDGILPDGDTDGLPVTISYDRSKSTDFIDRQISQRAEPRRTKAKGFHYRIPEYSDINISIGGQTRADARVLINQFGIVHHLPADDLEIIFHPHTGSVKSVGFIHANDE